SNKTVRGVLCPYGRDNYLRRRFRSLYQHVMKTTISIMVIVSILFYLIYKRSFSMVEETSDLFMMYAFVSNTVAFMLPLTVYIFCMITAALMSNILDLAYDPKKYAHIVSL